LNNQIPQGSAATQAYFRRSDRSQASFHYLLQFIKECNNKYEIGPHLK